ncbi:hypothetical protein [Flammeovirga sp. EKP202]|uniref:hypothetical protein n=1 Tax=Flammeovirga sp. EKP202 TaxID=2770592 RepID=UPI00165F48D6|nr:hypothetical protein [Flammeovirga sp. EKP202]MBD0402921.1 hypothetical protein [Flammeovirga sp. EKP202]
MFDKAQEQEIIAVKSNLDELAVIERLGEEDQIAQLKSLVGNLSVESEQMTNSVLSSIQSQAFIRNIKDLLTLTTIEKSHSSLVINNVRQYLESSLSSLVDGKKTF